MDHQQPTPQSQNQSQRNKENRVLYLAIIALSSFIVTTHIIPNNNDSYRVDIADSHQHESVIHHHHYHHNESYSVDIADSYQSENVTHHHYHHHYHHHDDYHDDHDDNDDNDDGNHNSNHIENIDYIPSYLEQYEIDHAYEYGFNETTQARPTSCEIVRNESFSDIYHEIQTYLQELAVYNQFIQDFIPIPDIRTQLLEGKTHDMICPPLQPPTDRIFVNSTKRIYRTSNKYNDSEPEKSSLALLSYSSNNGYLEPLLPPLRHLDLCRTGRSVMRLDYMVHDFYTMCRRIKKHSRIVLVDMGASLTFHAGMSSPATYLTSLYNKFGFYFDHIYAYEITQQEPSKVFELIPETFLSSYHWINIGVTADTDSRLNPLNILFRNFRDDDLIIVKLDIDTPHIETPLVYQLLNDTNLTNLVDHFYFEHHIYLTEMLGWWGRRVSGSVLESLQLFQKLRQKGVAAHYWP